MERYAGILLLLLILLVLAVVGRLQRQRWVKAAVVVFAAVTCGALAYQLREDPAAAWVLGMLGVAAVLMAGVEWAVERVRRAVRAWWRDDGRRPRDAFRCAHCGYDVRATPSAAGPRLATCPECGRETGR